MKRILVLSILFFSWASLNAQEGWDPFIPGVGGVIDNAGGRGTAVVVTAELALLRWPTENNLKNKFKDFGPEYEKRLRYYGPTVIDNGRYVIRDLDRVIARLEDLRTRNSAFHLYKGMKQKRLEEDLDNMLDVIRFQRTNIFDNGFSVTNPTSLLETLSLIAGGVTGKSSFNSIFGERLNLNQNVAMAMEKLDRKLDGIESTIEKRKLLCSFLHRYAH